MRGAGGGTSGGGDIHDIEVGVGEGGGGAKGGGEPGGGRGCRRPAAATARPADVHVAAAVALLTVSRRLGS